MPKPRPTVQVVIYNPIIVDNPSQGGQPSPLKKRKRGRPRKDEQPHQVKKRHL